MRFKHGHGETPEWNAWYAMVQRCYNEATPNYRYYGQRGITVCERWRTSFEAFLENMGPRPSAAHSLDRIDNDGNYEPGNCRWADQSTQCGNTRRAQRLEFAGKTQCLTHWAREFGLLPDTLRSRIAAGWDLERALTTPSSRNAKGSQA